MESRGFVGLQESIGTILNTLELRLHQAAPGCTRLHQAARQVSAMFCELPSLLAHKSSEACKYLVNKFEKVSEFSIVLQVIKLQSGTGSGRF